MHSYKNVCSEGAALFLGLAPGMLKVCTLTLKGVMHLRAYLWGGTEIWWDREARSREVQKEVGQLCVEQASLKKKSFRNTGLSVLSSTSIYSLVLIFFFTQSWQMQWHCFFFQFCRQTILWAVQVKLHQKLCWGPNPYSFARKNVMLLLHSQWTLRWQCVCKLGTTCRVFCRGGDLLLKPEPEPSMGYRGVVTGTRFVKKHSWN